MVGARGVGVGGLGILTRRSLTGGGGGTADALASGASEGNLVEVQILSAAPVAMGTGASLQDFARVRNLGQHGPVEERQDQRQSLKQLVRHVVTSSAMRC